MFSIVTAEDTILRKGVAMYGAVKRLIAETILTIKQREILTSDGLHLPHFQKTRRGRPR